jgi:putative ABC transport system permease protein
MGVAMAAIWTLDSAGEISMDILVGDLRYALRLFRRSPSLVLIIVTTLALGIGANTAIFSLMNALLLKTLPVKHARELVVLGDPTLAHLRAVNHPPRTDIFSYKLYTELRDGNSVFSDMLVSGEVPRLRVAMSGQTQENLIAEQAMGVLVSGNYFSTLGVDAFAGRTISPSDDDAPGAHPVAVVSYGFWKEKLAGTPTWLAARTFSTTFPLRLSALRNADFSAIPWAINRTSGSR